MRKKSVSVVGAIVVAVSIAATLAVPDRHVPLGAMTASYVGDGFFWLTNTTDRTLVAQLWYIEIQDGTNWIEWGTHNHQVELKPHSGALDAGLPLNVSPPTNNWRLRGIVGEKLEGFAEVKTAIRCYPSMISYRVRTGDTNVPLHPFPKGGSFYGGHREFVTAAAVGEMIMIRNWAHPITWQGITGQDRPNKAAPAKPAGAPLFYSHPVDRELAEPRRSGYK